MSIISNFFVFLRKRRFWKAIDGSVVSLNMNNSLNNSKESIQKRLKINHNHRPCRWFALPPWDMLSAEPIGSSIFFQLR